MVRGRPDRVAASKAAWGRSDLQPEVSAPRTRVRVHLCDDVRSPGWAKTAGSGRAPAEALAARRWIYRSPAGSGPLCWRWGGARCWFAATGGDRSAWYGGALRASRSRPGRAELEGPGACGRDRPVLVTREDGGRPTARACCRLVGALGASATSARGRSGTCDRALAPYGVVAGCATVR
jgi:hypothetical protein